jgi:coenzyme F420-0:L-glutamate ligase/coenzyme F420-1:gamma-L-glutamate ligase
MISIIGVEGIPTVKSGDKIGRLIVEASNKQGVGILDEDILVVTQKIVSKAEGRVIALDVLKASKFAVEISKSSDKDPRHTEAILRESRGIVKMRDNVLIMETKHGFICANAGVDRSNVSDGFIILLPEDPDESASSIMDEVKKLTGKNVAVIITDTWGRPWRLGQVDFAIGVAGMSAFKDYRGLVDPSGYELGVTNIAIADELASAAELAKGKMCGIPVVIIRGYDFPRGDGSGKDLIRPMHEDLFR